METLSYCQLMERCIALAAENAALKELKPIQADWICNTCATIYHTMNDDVAQGYIDEIRATLEREILLTPATDAFLAEVRAQGVEDIYQFNTDKVGVYLDGDVCALIDSYATQLRQNVK